MSLTPLLSAPAVIQIHAFSAFAAFVLGLVQFTAPKGTIPHRTLGWIWVALMVVVAISAIFIHDPRVPAIWGNFSPIHLFVIVTLVGVPRAVWYARGHRVSAHAKTMYGVFIGALLIAGAFTFLPGRIMHAVAFGGG
jgi:uncharacterized membrane protein